MDISRETCLDLTLKSVNLEPVVDHTFSYGCYANR